MTTVDTDAARKSSKPTDENEKNDASVGNSNHATNAGASAQVEDQGNMEEDISTIDKKKREKNSSYFLTLTPPRKSIPSARHRCMPPSSVLLTGAAAPLLSRRIFSPALLRGKGTRVPTPRHHHHQSTTRAFASSSSSSSMEKVSFGEGAIPGYECGSKTAPGIIVLQEWWGVTENIKKQALFISSKVGTLV